MKLQFLLFVLIVACVFATPSTNCASASYSCTIGPGECRPNYPAIAVGLVSQIADGSGGRGVLGGGKFKKAKKRLQKITTVPAVRTINEVDVKLMCLQRSCTSASKCKVFSYDLKVTTQQYKNLKKICSTNVENCSCGYVKAQLRKNGFIQHSIKLGQDMSLICPVYQATSANQGHSTLDLEASAEELEDQVSILEEEISSL
eukprot:gene2934-4773_t